MIDKIILFIGTFFAGFFSFLDGMRRAGTSKKIMYTYKRFAFHFLVISVMGYVLLSATMVLFIPVSLMFLLGPVLGTVAFIAFSSVASFISFILLIMGKFPTGLIGSKGVLRPFISMPKLTFIMASYLIPYSQDEFLLEGIDECCPQHGSLIRSIYKKPSSFGIYGIKLILFSIAQTIFFKVLSESIFNRIPEYEVYLEPILFSIQLGSQLTSIYTLRIQRMSVRDHIIWCGKNILRILGFTMPYRILDQFLSEWLSTLIFLGLGNAAVAGLVEKIVEDYGIKDKKGLFQAKVN